MQANNAEKPCVVAKMLQYYKHNNAWYFRRNTKHYWKCAVLLVK